MTGFPPEVRQQVWERSHGRCERCWIASYSYEFHHRRPRGMGGSKDSATNLASNCLLLCDKCHRWVEAHREEALSKGFLVRQGLNPAGARVMRSGEWVLLNEDGSITRRSGNRWV